MSSSCYANSQNCVYGCCDIYRSCPTYSSGCYFYYDSTPASGAIAAGAIAGIVIGVIFFVIFFILLIYCCRRIGQTTVVPPPVIVAPPPTQVYMIHQNNNPNHYNQHNIPPNQNIAYTSVNNYYGNQPQNYPPGLQSPYNNPNPNPFNNPNPNPYNNPYQY